jgi:hypothetical protein
MKTTMSGISQYILCILIIATSSAALAQSDYQVPQTIDGQPDLQGVWANNTLTPVERPDIFEGREFLTAEEVQILAKRSTEIQAAEGGDALFGDEVFISTLTGVTQSNDPTTGNYDHFWLAERNIHNRTSQIIDPPNGKYPPLSEAGIIRQETEAQLRNKNAAKGERFETLNSWLDLMTDDRCISAGAPYVESGCNSYWQIVQSKDYVVIVQEMIHKARIIPLTGMPHAPESIELWDGDSREYWDGDTLVVETRNYSDKHTASPNRAELNIEHFTRIGEKELLYRLTSDDPSLYSAPYTLEVIFDLSDGAIYEVACHEGNYAMANMLRGAREEERRKRQRQSSGDDI